MKLPMDLVIQFIAEGLVSWPTTSSGPKWADGERGKRGSYINEMGWWWSGESSFATLTDGEKIITRDIWVMAKLDVEAKNNPPRITSADEITTSKYTKQIRGVSIDVYDVLKAWGVTNPALQHLIKKALQCGERGHKDAQQDLQDIIDSAVRAKELEQ
ncbi:MAG: hypothetical protein ACRCR1_05815 [Aeromonas sp.]